MDRDFKAHVADELKAAIKRNELTREHAASQLGVTRSMLQRYLNATSQPRPHILLRACELWNCKFVYKGTAFDLAAFKTAAGGSEKGTVEQMLLIAVGALADRHPEIQVLKKSARSVELHVRVNFA